MLCDVPDPGQIRSYYVNSYRKRLEYNAGQSLPPAGKNQQIGLSK
jgi:hypothetical protein